MLDAARNEHAGSVAARPSPSGVRVASFDDRLTSSSREGTDHEPRPARTRCAAVPVAGGAAGASFPVRRIYCVGRNYVEHAKEMGFTGREPPFFFLKPADAVVPVAEGSVGRMRYPSLTKSLHHEVELVVAIGKRRPRHQGRRRDERTSGATRSAWT